MKTEIFSMNKLIIFDFDGVLIDSELLGCQVWSDCLKPYADVSLQAMLGYTGRTGALICKMIEKDYRCTLPPDFLSHVNVAVEDLMERELLPVKGVLETLPKLTLPMCIASGSRPERLFQCVRVAHLTPYFNKGNTFSSHYVKNGKPAPDIFLYAAEKMGESAENCVVIEDSVSGVVGAKAAKMTVFGFTGGSHCAPDHGEKLKAAGADLTFGDFTKLPDLLV